MAQFTMSPACSGNRQYKIWSFCRRRRTGPCHFLRQIQKSCLISVALSALFSVPLNAQPLPYSRKKLLLVFQTRLANGSILRLRCQERALARRLNQRGEVVGIVSFRAGNNSCVIRPAANAGALLTQVSSSTIASWQVLSLAHPTPPTTTRTATPTKIPLRGSKLTYAPAPRYPAEVKHSQWTIKGSGNFRVLFDANGHTVTVQTVRSTGNPLLDQAAVSALHDWRSEPGREWSLVVPITFQP